MPARDRTFRAGEMTLRYRAEGGGPTIVLIHGWTFDLKIWDRQCAAWRGEMRVVRIDRRGFGRSGGDPDPDADPQDLALLLDHLRVARAALVGMSQGARAALGFALRWPGRVSCLVLDGPPDCLGGREPEGDGDLPFESFRALARAQGLEAFREAWSRHPLMRLHTDDPAARELLSGALARYRGLDLYAARPATAQPVEAASLARLRMPVLIVNGEHDTPARGRAAEALLRLLPCAERARVPDAGHLANLDNPSAYNAVILDFLRRKVRVAA